MELLEYYDTRTGRCTVSVDCSDVLVSGFVPETKALPLTELAKITPPEQWSGIIEARRDVLLVDGQQPRLLGTPKRRGTL